MSLLDEICAEAGAEVLLPDHRLTHEEKQAYQRWLKPTDPNRRHRERIRAAAETPEQREARLARLREYVRTHHPYVKKGRRPALTREEKLERKRAHARANAEHAAKQRAARLKADPELRDRLNAKKRARRAANLEAVRAHDRAYRAANRDRYLATYRAWAAINRPPKAIAHIRAYQATIRSPAPADCAVILAERRAWETANPERAAELRRKRAADYQRIWREENKDRIAQYRKRPRDPEKAREQRALRKARIRAAREFLRSLGIMVRKRDGAYALAYVREAGLMTYDNGVTNG